MCTHNQSLGSNTIVRIVFIGSTAVNRNIYRFFKAFLIAELIAKLIAFLLLCDGIVKENTRVKLPITHAL